MSSRDDQVCRANQAILINSVVVDERAARCLGNTDSLKLVRFGMCSHSRTQDIWLVQQHLHALAGIEDLNEPRIMVEERTGAVFSISGQEFFSLNVCFRCATAFTHQEPC